MGGDALLRVGLVFWIEVVCFGLVGVAALLQSGRCRRFSWLVGKPLRSLARRPAVGIAFIAGLSFVGSALVSLLVRFPEPAVHDEFSYLLAADTFASGRLTNPTHPLWEHFQTFHVIQEPSYASKYLPGQGLLLGLGVVLAGDPVVGVWLGSAFGCAAICWMLYAWLPRRWALLGGFLTALNFGFFGYWSQKYWGGMLALAGGAMVYGALGRLLRRPSASSGVALGMGLVVLAYSRPLEGAVVSLPAVIILLKTLSESDRDSAKKLGSSLAIASVLLFLGFAWLGYYNFRVTGDPFELPYQIYQEKYPSSPVFLWQSPRTLSEDALPSYRVYAEYSLRSFEWQRTLAGYLTAKSQSLKRTALLYFRFVLMVGLFALPFAWRDRRVRLAMVPVLLVLLVILVERQTGPRKLAPAGALLIFLSVSGLRYLEKWKISGRQLGTCLVSALPLICLFSVALSFLPALHDLPWLESRLRGQVESVLGSGGEKHLILVHYERRHRGHFEWVYNRASIDDSAVIWAHSLSPEKNRRAVEYFSDRRTWVLEADGWWMRGPLLVPWERWQTLGVSEEGASAEPDRR